MKLERKLEIEKEAKKRLDLWLKHSNFDEMSVGSNKMRFDMSLGLFGGYPFKKKNWMVGFHGFITEKEFYSQDYDEIITKLFYEKICLLN